MSIELGPEAMDSLMHEVLAWAQHTMQRYEGTITQYLGGGFVALFGAPVAHEDHATSVDGSGGVLLRSP